jgi:hypothetical protein
MTSNVFKNDRKYDTVDLFSGGNLKMDEPLGGFLGVF